MGSGREAHGKENPRKPYAVGLRTEPALLVRGSSRRITIMRFRPANIRVINRRNSRLDRDLRCLLRRKKKQIVLDWSFHIRAQKIEPGQFLFQSECKGEPANLETITRRLSQREIPGFHSFRRFRLTHLRKARIPEDLIRYWIGHDSKDVSDRYSKLAEDLEFRKHWALAGGLGFDLQALGHPNRLRKRRGHLERLQLTLKGDAKPPVYAATDEDLPAYFFAPAP